MSDCRTVRFLKQITTDRNSDPQLVEAAKATMAIVTDLENTLFSSADLQCLHDLIDAVYRDGQAPLFDHLRDGVVDCRVCAALASRIERLDAA